MSITLLFQAERIDPITGKIYWEKGIPYTFGEMNPDYYNNLTDDAKARDYGYYLDNVIKRGSNIWGTLTKDSEPFEFSGVLSSDFNGDSIKYREVEYRYKITDDLFAKIIQTVRVDPTWTGTAEGEAQISLGFNLVFYSTLTMFQNKEFTISPMFGNFQVGKYTYNDFYNLCEGMNPTRIAVLRERYECINAYPNNKEKVEASKTSTGCLIQNFTLFRDYNSENFEFRAYQFATNCFGIPGSIVQPYNNSTETRQWVPYILGAGFEAVFPESESDIIPGDYDTESDFGDVPGVPMTSAVNSSFARLYQMSSTQLRAFADFLWSDFSEWDKLLNNLKMWFTNPLDSIIGVTISPVDYFYNYENDEVIPIEPINIKLAGVDIGVQGYPCSNNYMQISLGKLNLKPFYNSFLDCNPHTKYSLYLPYIGFKDIDGDALFSIGGTEIEIVYSVDILSGVCVANVKVIKESNNTKLHHILYTFAGNMNTYIPISSADMKSTISATLGAIASGVAIAATGGASSTLVAAGLAAQQGVNVASQKLNISRSGGMSLESGMFGIQYAYLIVTRPREARPSNYKNVNGIPSEIGGKLNSFLGFTQVSSVHVNIEGATDTEKDEIEKLLKEGVIL